MKKYMVYYSGVAYVEAEDEASARENFIEDNFVTDDRAITTVEEVDEFDFDNMLEEGEYHDYT